ncbi:phosphatase PAP2 family protein [Mucilaginibacter robiniae]|uniref:Phosphatase PAP2 family protein n=1 Tax=Mucilaginibacter robiniae TaxID=2728022 RepID=A0A7L5E2Y0_9SPHI|nr:phosphatase PAP2 family protein [Mucilaginibacter robiniae]QJD94696.1 phosphatase PAP2 family protein [Mucilaginibacter robiniae]
MNTRITDVLHQIRLLFVPYLIILITCLIIKLSYTREAIYYAINAHYDALADHFFTYATSLGEGITVVTLSVGFLLVSYRKALLLGTSFAFTGILVQIVKHIYHAKRPVIYFAQQLNHIHFVKGVHLMTTNSFPSGHTVSAFTAATVLSYLAVNKRLGFIYLLLAIAVAYSRMYLSEHFFEDVTAGSIIGTMGTVIWITWLDGLPFMKSQRWNKGLLRR